MGGVGEEVAPRQQKGSSAICEAVAIEPPLIDLGVAAVRAWRAPNRPEVAATKPHLWIEEDFSFLPDLPGSA
jgi:hypothetical protein